MAKMPGKFKPLYGGTVNLPEEPKRKPAPIRVSGKRTHIGKANGPEEHLVIDPEMCILCGYCYEKMPKVFRFDEDIDAAVVHNEFAASREQIEQMIEWCPSGAIDIVRGGVEPRGSIDLQPRRA